MFSSSSSQRASSMDDTLDEWKAITKPGLMSIPLQIQTNHGGKVILQNTRQIETIHSEEEEKRQEKGMDLHNTRQIETIHGDRDVIGGKMSPIGLSGTNIDTDLRHACVDLLKPQSTTNGGLKLDYFPPDEAEQGPKFSIHPEDVEDGMRRMENTVSLLCLWSCEAEFSRNQVLQSTLQQTKDLAAVMSWNCDAENWK